MTMQGTGPQFSDRTIHQDVPYTMRLPDGQTVFVLIPARWCERDISGEVLFTMPAVRLLDRLRVMAMTVPDSPTPGYIRTLREALKMTQKELAERLGVNKMTVARWEWGKVKPNRTSLKALDRLRRRAARKGILLPAA